MKLPSFYSGNFKICKNALGQFIPNRPSKHVVTIINYYFCCYLCCTQDEYPDFWACDLQPSPLADEYFSWDSCNSEEAHSVVHDRSDPPIMRHLLCACVFPNDIRRIFRCRLSGLIPAHTPLKVTNMEF